MFRDPAIVLAVACRLERVGGQSRTHCGTPGTTRPLPIYECSRPDSPRSPRRFHDRHRLVRDARRNDPAAPGVRRGASGTGNCRSRSDGGGSAWRHLERRRNGGVCSARLRPVVPAALARGARVHRAGIPSRGGRAVDAPALQARRANCDSRHGVRRQRRCRRDARRGGDRRGPLLGVWPSAANRHVRRSARRSGGERTSPAGLSAKHHCGRARRVRRLSVASQSRRGDAGPGSVAGGADRSSRVAAARVGDSLSGLSLCVCRSLSEASAVAACPRRSGVVAVCGDRGAAGRSARDCRSASIATMGRISRSSARSSASGSSRRWRILSSSAELSIRGSRHSAAARTIGSSERIWVSGSLGRATPTALLDVDLCAARARARRQVGERGTWRRGGIDSASVIRRSRLAVQARRRSSRFRPRCAVLSRFVWRS